MNRNVEATLVIPTYNRRALLRHTLECVARLSHLPPWEAVIVDDGSTDGTSDAVTAFGGTRDLPLRMVRQPNRGPAAARNRGAAEARGHTLIFLDDDLEVPGDFVAAHLAALADNPGAWVVGRVVHPPAIRATAFGRYRDDLTERFQHAHSAADVSTIDGLTAANLSLPAADFRRLGGFDERFTIASCEDADLGLRARAAGIRVLYQPAIVVIHNDWAVTLEGFCERQRLYAISDVVLWRKYGAASPRARVVCENGPLRWRSDRPVVMAKKLVKKALATAPGRRLLRQLCGISERLAPDTAWTHRCYDWAVAVAIFRGVRQSLRDASRT